MTALVGLNRAVSSEPLLAKPPTLSAAVEAELPIPVKEEAIEAIPSVDLKTPIADLILPTNFATPLSVFPSAPVSKLRAPVNGLTAAAARPNLTIIVCVSGDSSLNQSITLIPSFRKSLIIGSSLEPISIPNTSNSALAFANWFCDDCIIVSAMRLVAP